MKLSIIIVSYNVRHYVEQCLLSVYASLRQGDIDGEVFVVDNDSPTTPQATSPIASPPTATPPCTSFRTHAT